MMPDIYNLAERAKTALPRPAHYAFITAAKNGEFGFAIKQMLSVAPQLSLFLASKLNHKD